MWNQIYDPLSNPALSTIAAAVPVVSLLIMIASGRVKAHIAAIIAVILTNLITIVIFTMPVNMSIRASVLGIVTGFFPIGWIVLNVIFLYQVTVATGKFELLKRAVGGVTEDRRVPVCRGDGHRHLVSGPDAGASETRVAGRVPVDHRRGRLQPE